jgi:Protein of unknown function (DUF499)
MNLQNVWEVCKFSDEIVYGRLDVSKFAVELHSVLDGFADKTYTDPNLFLKSTFLTSNAKLILKDALVRVSRGEGQPVYIIDTEFGGGKTHTLILLYHIFKNEKLAREYIRQYGLDEDYSILEAPQAKVVAIDCRRLRKKTLWGEIADLLGRYNEIREFDENRQQIKNIEVLKSFFNVPTLLLIDELPHYLLSADAEKIGNITLADLTIAFVMNLISAVAASRNTILIMTLTAKQQLYENYTGKIKSSLKSKTFDDFRVDRLVDDFKEGLSRQVQFKTPVDRKEIYDVIRTRLVKSINENEKNKVINDFYNYYVDKGITADPDLKTNMRKAYPLHSFLLDVLYERVASIDKFNKTRGILRLLALVLHNIYKKQEECKLVSTSDIQLHDSEIAEELTSRIDRADFKTVIESDCIKKSKALDEKRNIKIFERISRTIYLYSMIGTTKVSGIKPNDIAIAVCQQGIDPSLIDEALNQMDKTFWYLRKNGVEYYFDKEPQINKIIYDYMQEVNPREIKNKIREMLISLIPERVGVNVIIWDKEKLEDNEELKIFALNYEEGINDENEKELLRPLVEYKPDGGIRNYQNTIVFVYADEHGIDSLLDNARMVCAIENAQKDERIKSNRDNLSTIRTRLTEAGGNLISECLNVYSKVAYPYLTDIRPATISMLETKNRNITESLLELLTTKGKLIASNLSSDVIDDLFKEKTKVEDIYSLFKKDKSKRFILSGKVLLDAVKEGVKKGLFGYANELTIESDGKYVAETNKEVNVDWNGWVIKKGLVYEELVSKPSPPEPIPLKPIRDDELQYNYRIEFNDPKEIVSVLERYPILSVGGKARADCYVELKNESDKITIQSKLKQSLEIKSLVQSLLNTNRYAGIGHIIIKSDTDLNDEFARYKIKAKKL